MGAHVSSPMYRRTLPQRLRLEGRRCAACERLHFPPLAACPACGGARLEPHELRPEGVIEALTTAHPGAAPPEFARMAYYVAIVRLDEGPAITAQLTGFARPPRIGQPVVAVVRRLYEQEGVVRYGFKFRPAEGGEPQ